ncbi:hypothetical protein PanWU01x14_219210 [Parasponia andersonii]|uniref:Uncharacterized protein n=1 Tax=Parasponia andersonii TaxID=3476 RepID=A0A2P5BQI9_PARAD|nr:hypothetical protein PanWU01x14_219210 [Parasponia andersonii]
MSYLDVHEMEMDYSGWFLKFRVDLFMLSEAYPDILFQDLFLFSMVCVVRGEPEEEAESCLVLKISGKVMI